jgi:choline-glycine betaine transporter
VARKHLLLCAIPLIGGALYLVNGGNVNTLATIGLVAACPFMHIFMMKHGDHPKKKGGEHHHET